jgi:glucokinase
MLMYAIGIDLGGTNLKAALVHREKGIVKQQSLPTEAERGVDHVLDQMALAATTLAKESEDECAGIGIGSPGSISMDRKHVAYPPNFPGWTDVNVAEEMQKRTGLGCLVENDANVAALGSSRFGVGKDFDSMIMLTLGTGVGGGIIINRELYRGTTGAAGELGHVIIDYHGPESNSQTRGGVEAYLGQRFMSRYAADVLRRDPDNPLTKRFSSNWEELEPIHLFEAANSGNESAKAIFTNAGEKLGYAIVNYVHILDIRKIVISGGVAKAGEMIFEPARRMALSKMMKPFHKDFEIIYEPLGNDAAQLGAASLAFEYL